MKHTEIVAYAELHELDIAERWHLYLVVIAMDDVLIDHHAEKKSG